MIPFILLFVGLLLIFLEFYTPGGILAVCGIIALLFGVTLFLTSSTSLLASVAFIGLMIAGVSFVIWFALHRIKKSGAKNTFYLSSDQEGYQGAAFDASLIGKQGDAVTDLGPSGFIVIEGARYQASCRGPYLDRGKKVIVIGGEGARLLVKPVN